MSHGGGFPLVSTLSRLRAWWREQLRPTRCRECGAELADDSGFCSDEHYVGWMERGSP